MRTLLFLLSAFVLAAAPTSAQETEATDDGRPPNIIFIMADDLGYGDLGAYGQGQIQTPRLDQMADEGMRFTQFYAGATVCAPSRSVLMTGLHTGHTRVRGNAGGDLTIQALQPEDVTVAEVLANAGYTNGLVGKWGLGDEGAASFGLPTNQGFDHFFGYLNQVHAHNYYPEFLWLNEEKVPLRNEVERVDNSYGGFTGGYATTRVDYTHDLFADSALAFVERHESEPFFLYLALTIPHANNEERHTDDYHGMEVPDYGPYADTDWPEPQKGHAAMITRMDADMGRLLDRIDSLGLGENTIIFFTSDNGPHNEGQAEADFFDSNGPLRGTKRALYDGGIRVPMIVRWTGHVPAGTTNDYIGYAGDFMATAADLAGTTPPDSLDSISLVPTLLGNNDEQVEHEYLYWEFYEQGSRQAVRMGPWKGIRQPMFTGEIELYNVEKDLGEENNVAAEHSDVVAEIEAIMEEAHVESPAWQVATESAPK